MRIVPPRGEAITIEDFILSTVDDDGTGAPILKVPDRTGDSVPDLVIEGFSGGAHCCLTVHLVELRPDGSACEIAVIDAAHGGSFGDVDGDGTVEFVMNDWSLAYQLGCFACIDLPTIVLKWGGSGFELAPTLMQRPPPTMDELQLAASALDDESKRRAAERTHSADAASVAGMLRDLLVSRMLGLIYHGNGAAAWQLFDAAWPSVLEGEREAQRDAIRAALAGSPWHAEVEAMQQHWSEFEFDETKRSATPATAP